MIRSGLLGLCIDVGKSGARGRLTGPDIDAVVRTAGIEPEAAGRPDGGLRLLKVAEAIWRQLQDADGVTPGRLGRLVVGSTSLPQASQIDYFLECARERWPNAAIAVADDGLLGHAAAVGGPGNFVSIGTGVIVYGLDRHGIWRRKDGWGPDLGDRGGAFWLGSAGLGEALRAADGAAPGTALLEEARRYLGGVDHAAAVRLAGRTDRAAALAGFARAVCKLAPQDPVAEKLVTRAATLVCESVAAMSQVTNIQTISVGGQLALDEIYWESLKTRCNEAGLRCFRADTSAWEAEPDLLFTPAYAAACAGMRS